jgi:uncharacterized phage-associated protein
MSSARSVAKELVRLSLSGPRPDPLTPFRLQVLLSYAQAWSLALRGSEVFPDDIRDKPEGPEVPAIVVALLDCPEIVCSRAFDEDPRVDDEDEAVFLGHLWAAFGRLSPSGLDDAIREGRSNGGLVELSRVPAALEAYRRVREEREKEAEQALRSVPPPSLAFWEGARSTTPSVGKP